uniref:RNA-directed DNA polymerase n=1 Tax=Trichogramma kaykai TaxID=54128 RepID=A0ABD2XHQ2_9HYME
MAMVTPSRDTVADSRSGPIALLRSIENLPDRQCDRNERENAPVEWSDPDEITLVSSECVAAPRFLTQDRVCEDESEPEEAHEIITRAEIHETSEKDQAEDGRQIIYIDIAAMSQENRFFVNVQVGKFTYRALMDSGAQCCLAGPKMMKDLAGRIRPSPTVIGFANSQDESSSGCLPVMLQVDREPGRVVFECVEILPVEMVLGADFGRRWRVDIGMGRDQWRSNDGPWHDFAKPSDTKMRNYAITAECAGQFQFRRLPFGLKCAPMTFQRLMDKLFCSKVEKHVFAYLDDIILVTETFEQHMIWIERVIRTLIDAKLVVNRDKCEFCCQSVKFLGYVLDSSGFRVDSDRVRPIYEYPAPRNVKQVRRLLGMVGWYSRFIKNEAEIKVPLAKLLRKDVVFVWGAEQEQAFETLKRCLSEAPVLVRPDFSKEFSIQTDASDYAVGAVLTQEYEDGEHPVYYVSRVLSRAEQRYTTTEKECLAVIWAIEKFRPYVEGSRFKVVTDHRALTWLRNFKDPQGRVARWAFKLMEYDFEIVYRKGSVHYVPDALSRAFDKEVCAFEKIEDEWYLKKRLDVQREPSKFRDWTIEDGMLYKRGRSALLDPVTNAENGWRLVVPAERRQRVLFDAHSLTSSGHLGAKKTYDRAACEYWWPGMWYDVEKFCSACEVCQRYKVPQTGPTGLMTRRVVDRPWVVVAADMMEFPRSKNQNKYLLVFQDLFTRWIEVVPLKKATGANVLRAFEELVLFRWETPEFFLTDNGREFDNKLLNEALEEYGVKHLFTPPYHAQANVVERSNRTLKTMIASFVNDKHDEWDRYLPQFRYAELLVNMDRNNVNEGQKRSYAAVVAGGGGERTPSVSLTASDGNEAAPSSVRIYASEEARASRDAEAELESYLSREELGASALSRSEPEGMLVVEVSGVSSSALRDVPVEEGEITEDWETSVDPVDFHYHRPAWQRTDAEKRRARKQRRRLNGPGQRQRTPSPGEGRRPNPDNNTVTEEERREMLEALVAARNQVEEWDGEIATEVYAGSQQEEELLLADPPAAMLHRPREGEVEVSVEPPYAPLVWREVATLPPEPVSMISYVMGPHGLMFQPMQQQLQPWGFMHQHQQPYPLQQHHQELRRPQHHWQSCQLQQQHLQLAQPPQVQQHQQPALFQQQQQQQQYHQQEAMVVDRSHRAGRLISPVFWPSPTSEDADVPSRSVRGSELTDSRRTDRRQRDIRGRQGP